MVELTDIQGIGPATAEALQDEGVDSVEDLSESDAQTLTQVENVTEQNAQMFIVRAQDLLGENEVDVSEEDMPDDDDVTEEVTEDLFPESPSSDESEDVEEESVESEESVEESGDDDGLFELTLDLNDRQYDLMMFALVEDYVNQQRRNIDRAAHADSLVQTFRSFDGEGEYTMRLSRGELNTLYSAARSKKLNLQGRNRIDLMEEMMEVVDVISDTRDELF